MSSRPYSRANLEERQSPLRKNEQDEDALLKLLPIHDVLWYLLDRILKEKGVAMTEPRRGIQLVKLDLVDRVPKAKRLSIVWKLLKPCTARTSQLPTGARGESTHRRLRESGIVPMSTPPGRRYRVTLSSIMRALLSLSKA